MRRANQIGVSVAVSVLLIHAAAFAQPLPAPQAPPPTPEPAPQPTPEPPPGPASPPAPPPSPTRPAPYPAPYPYPYAPPPGYQPAPPLPYYYPTPPAARGVYRSFTIALGLGSGWLSLPRPRDHEGGLTYLARVGFGVTRDWIVFLGLDGAVIGAPELSQTNYLLGAQYFFARRFYCRGGLGLATVSEEGAYDDGGPAGQAFVAGLGVEVVQGESVALGVEWSSGVARFPSGSYFQNGLGLTLVFY
jgi:hypothetical protein